MDDTFAMREQLLITQALTIAIKHLKALEERDEIYPVGGEHAQPSNRADMEYLLEHSYSLYSELIQ